MDPAIERMLQTYGVTPKTAAFLRDMEPAQLRHFKRSKAVWVTL